MVKREAQNVLVTSTPKGVPNERNRVTFARQHLVHNARHALIDEKRGHYSAARNVSPETTSAA
jgi:hypothetical protein